MASGFLKGQLEGVTHPWIGQVKTENPSEIFRENLRDWLRLGQDCSDKERICIPPLLHAHSHCPEVLQDPLSVGPE